MSARKDITCKEAGCTFTGHFQKQTPEGERVICANARHNHEWHVTEFKLAEETVKLLKRDRNFREYFNKLLAA